MPLIPQPPAVGRFDTAVHQWITRHDVPAKVDAGLVRLSGFADHSKLWGVTALAMIPMGQRGRKATTRPVRSR